MELARALCAEPALLLLDEPAAGSGLLEKEGAVEVLRRLLGEGLSILLVEHDMDLVMSLVDRVAVMKFGTKSIEGSPKVVRASAAVRAAYLGGGALTFWSFFLLLLLNGDALRAAWRRSRPAGG